MVLCIMSSFMYQIRQARDEDLPQLAGLEAAGDSVFPEGTLSPSPSEARLRQSQLDQGLKDSLLWVVESLGG